MKKTGLSLGPVLFNWQVEKWRDFYFRIADEADLDRVYLGEVVCSKRQPFFDPWFPQVLERLQAAGKQVVVSTLALIMNKREMNGLRELAGFEDLMLEANDVAAVALLRGRDHCVGPYVNVYNEGTLDYLHRNGASHVTLPVEMRLESMRKLSANSPVSLEVQAFGRLPLALSARCYHARHHKLTKDGCQFVCEKDPDGMDLDTLDGEEFLAVNGIQTMSYAYANLLGDLDLLADAGISMFRLSPQDCDMVAVADLFRKVIAGDLDPAGATDQLEDISRAPDFCNGYLYGREGARQFAADELAAYAAAD